MSFTGASFFNKCIRRFNWNATFGKNKCRSRSSNTKEFPAENKFNLPARPWAATKEDEKTGACIKSVNNAYCLRKVPAFLEKDGVFTQDYAIRRYYFYQSLTVVIFSIYGRKQRFNAR